LEEVLGKSMGPRGEKLGKVTARPTWQKTAKQILIGMPCVEDDLPQAIV
jgi:hypothetical protein